LIRYVGCFEVSNVTESAPSLAIARSEPKAVNLTADYTLVDCYLREHVVLQINKCSNVGALVPLDFIGKYLRAAIC
jgi:hypothetical protein